MGKSKKLKTEKYLKEYKQLKEQYRSFSSAIKFILENLLSKNYIRYQAVTFREKSEKSLKDKLKKIGKLKSVTDIKDLAGCRIIFYLDSDIQRVIQYLHAEFEIVEQNLKYSVDNYNALHLIVKLNQDRLKLTEYERFTGLKCEIQLTTVLYHSWSELAHDVIYKPETTISEFDKGAFDSIKRIFHDVMKDHIKQAQHSFDYIFQKIEKIMQGKQVFDVAFLKSIIDSTSNNEIYENLKILLKYIEEFGDKTPEELKIIEIINNALEKSKKLKIEPIKTAFGELQGHDYSDIAVVCLDILNRLRFTYPNEVFDALIQLSVDENEKVKRKALDAIGLMAKYIFLPEKNEIDYYRQLIILDGIEKLNNKRLLACLSFVIKVSKELLSPSFEYSSRSDDNSFIFHRGPLPARKIVKKIRERTILILKELYSLSETISEKQQILNALEQVTTLPLDGDTTDLEKIILKNANALVAYYIFNIKEADNEIIMLIENQAQRFEKRFQGGLDNLNKLKTLIEENKEYGLYKVLVGWDYQFSEDLDYKVVVKERKQKIDEHIKQITCNNFLKWEKRILSIIKNYKQHEDDGQFQYFKFFLKELGKEKPLIALRLISENEEKLQHFHIHLLAGIWQSNQRENAIKIVENWTEQKKHLSTCAHIFEFVKEIDEAILNKIFEKAKEQGDIWALTNIVRSIVENFNQFKAGKGLFLECIKELTTLNNCYWVNYVWIRGKTLLETFNKNDWDVFLNGLLIVPNFDHRLEDMLSDVALNSPKVLIDFFYERMKIKRNKTWKEKYDAIPFKFRKLKKALSQNAKLVVEEILRRFKKEDQQFYWEGGRLLQAIFPKFDSELEKQLIKLLRSKNKKRARIIYFILRSYKGEIFLHEVCKEFIKQFSHKDDYSQKMFIVLSQTGGVLGEYGLVEAYKKKKKEIQDWKDEKCNIIQNFSIEYENYLNKQIDYEKKRVDETIEIRKREFEG